MQRRHAFAIDKAGSYEVAFSRRSDMAGLWIGEHLIRMLLEWSLMAGAKRLIGVTYVSNHPMRALFEVYRFDCTSIPDEPGLVSCEAEVAEITADNPANTRWRIGPAARCAATAA